MSSLSNLAGIQDLPRFSHDIDTTCSTPFVSAPSTPSPGHAPSGYFFSAPASPMHFILSTHKAKAYDYDEPVFMSSDSASFEFQFSSRFSPDGLTSADELFFNGQIRPMKQRPQAQDEVPPFAHHLHGEHSDGLAWRGRDLRMCGGKHIHRKARSMSPLRSDEYDWQGLKGMGENVDNQKSSETTPSCSASSSRSSSSGRNSKKWIFLKDLLNRSKSQGRANNKDRFWSAIYFSPTKDKKSFPALSPSSSRDEEKNKSQTKKTKETPAGGKPAKGVWKRRVPPSAHELHYTTNRAQAEKMKKKTFLPYREGLLGCLGFSSKSYGALSGFTRNLNPISSR